MSAIASMPLQRFLDYGPSYQALWGGPFDDSPPLQIAQGNWERLSDLPAAYRLGPPWDPGSDAYDQPAPPFDYDKIQRAFALFTAQTEIDATVADRLTRPLPFQETPFMALAKELDWNLPAKIASAALCIFEALYQTLFRYLVAPVIIWAVEQSSPNTAEVLRVRLASPPTARQLLFHRILQICGGF